MIVDDDYINYTIRIADIILRESRLRREAEDKEKGELIMWKKGLNSNEAHNLRECPFCGGRVIATHGCVSLEKYYFKCFNCGAVVSFDNDDCTDDPKRAFDYYNSKP